jgi:hypothetical protein
MRMINCFLGREWRCGLFDTGDGQIIKPVIKPVFLVPYSRKSVIKNKKSGGYYKIRMLK